MLTLGVYLVTVKMAYSIRRKGQPSSTLVEGVMFTPSALGRKGKQHVGCSCNRGSAYLKSHCTPTFDAQYHPSCRRSASFCLSSYDPYATAYPVAWLGCCCSPGFWLLPASFLRTDRSVRHLPSSVGTCVLQRVSSILALATDSWVYMSC